MLNIPIRFFIYDLIQTIDGDSFDLIEVSEAVWLDYDGIISYERDTVRENGVSQIILTKRS